MSNTPIITDFISFSSSIAGIWAILNSNPNTNSKGRNIAIALLVANILGFTLHTFLYAFPNLKIFPNPQTTQIDVNILNIKDMPIKISTGSKITNNNQILPANLSVIRDEDLEVVYQIDTTTDIADRTDFWTDFSFNKEIDLSLYKSVEVSVKYNVNDISCGLLIYDGSGHEDQIDISKQPPLNGNELRHKDEYLISTIILQDSFRNVNLSLAKGIIVVCKADPSESHPNKQFSVKNITFLK